MSNWNVRWYNAEKTILLQTLSGNVTLEDYIELSGSTYELLSTVDHHADVIADVGGVLTVPTNFVAALRRSHVRHHANLGVVIVVGLENKLIRAMFNVLLNLTPSLKDKYLLAFSLDTAAAILERRQYPLAV
jgi:hypothetical protein